MEDKATIREKTEQVLVPVKAELIWFALLILAIIAAYQIGIIREKIGFLEDHDIVRTEQEIRNAEKQTQK